MSSLEFALTALSSFLVGLLSKVVADYINDYRKRLRFEILPSVETIIKTPVRNLTVIYFGLDLEQGKDIDNAKVYCNSNRYDWLNEDKSRVAKKKLLVGDPPSWFCPYELTFDYVNELSKRQNVIYNIDQKMNSENGVAITVKELSRNDIVFSRIYSIPKNASSS